MEQNTANILNNILGGLLTSALVLLFVWLKQRIKASKIIRLLGKDALQCNDYYLIYPQFVLNKELKHIKDFVEKKQEDNPINVINSDNYYQGSFGTSGCNKKYHDISSALTSNSTSHYEKVSGSSNPKSIEDSHSNNVVLNHTFSGNENSNNDNEFIFKHWKNNESNYKIDEIVANSEVRAINYLSSKLFNQLYCKNKIRSDKDMENTRDFSMICFGGSTLTYFNISNEINLSKSIDEVESSYKSLKLMELIDGNSSIDYGFIIKTMPKNKLDRVWICCYGLEGWGTSGAAWYLSNRYEELYDKLHSWSCNIDDYLESDDVKNL